MREERTIGLGSGLAGVILVIVIAWALAAVLMLTGTLTNARQINKRVKLVNAQVGPIDKNLASVALAGRTGRIAAKINSAARPLVGELSQVITAAGHIDATAGTILTTAGSINGVVNTINSNARAINGTVHAINATVNSINGHVQAIAGSVASIGGSVSSIHGRVVTVESVVGPIGASDGSINANVTRIRANLGTTLSTARQIRVGVIDINNRAQVVIGLAKLLKSDFDRILAGVGTGNGTGTIHGHANSIDCSRLINLLGPTPSCGQ